MEDEIQQRRPKQKCAAGQASDDHGVNQNVQHRFPLPVRFARQKIIGAHGEAQRQHRDRGSDDQEELFVYAELRLVEPADQQHRQRQLKANATVLANISQETCAVRDPLFWRLAGVWEALFTIVSSACRCAGRASE